MEITKYGVRVAAPLEPLDKIVLPPTLIMAAVENIATGIVAKYKAPVILSVDEETQEFILTPDPNRLYFTDTPETTHRVRGYVITAILDKNDPATKKTPLKDGLNRSKIVYPTD